MDLALPYQCYSGSASGIGYADIFPDRMIRGWLLHVASIFFSKVESRVWEMVLAQLNNGSIRLIPGHLKENACCDTLQILLDYPDSSTYFD